MSRFKNFFKNRFRKEEPITPEETEFIHNLREALLRAQGSEISEVSPEASSSSDTDVFDSVVPFSPATEPAELPHSKIPSVSVEEQALDEDSSVDEIYAHHIRARIFRQRIASPMGKVLTIAFVGQLRDGSLAWIGNDDLSFGHSDPSVFSPLSPSAGDEIRAKVIGYAWGCVVGALVPDSFRTAEQVDSDREKSLSTPTDAAGVVPPLALNTWKQVLKPGDLVLAHVPFDGTYGTTKNGAISKNRPAMFVRWEDDYAIIRAIYGSGRHVDNNGLGTPLKDNSVLKKKSVIRNSEMDIRVDGLLKSLGRLGPSDLLQLGYISSAGSKKTPKTTERRKVNLRIVPKLPTRAVGSVPFSRSTDPLSIELHNVGQELIRQGEYQDTRDLLNDLVSSISELHGLQGFLENNGVGLAEIGTIFHFLVGHSNLDSNGSNLGELITPVLEALNDSRDTKLEIVPGIHRLPVLRWCKSVPVSSLHIFEDCTFTIPDDYESPDLVFLDQLAVADILGGSRLNFRRALEDVTLGENVPCLFVGSTEDAKLQQLHRAATHAGWICKSADTSESRLEILLSAQREYGAQLVTVISKYSDLVAELENIGCEVQILGEVSE
jgi:hypothetical protein